MMADDDNRKRVLQDDINAAISSKRAALGEEEQVQSNSIANGATVVNPNEIDLHFKLLCPQAIIGMIIGKGGSVIRRMNESPGVQIQLSQDSEYFPATTDRVLVLNGTHEGLKNALSELVTKIAEGQSKDKGKDSLMTGMKPSNLSNSHYNIQQHQYTIQLIVPKHSAGFLIGKQGVVIKQMSASTSCHFQLGSDQDPYHTKERILNVQSSTIPQLVHGTQTAMLQLLSDPLSRIYDNKTASYSKQPPPPPPPPVPAGPPSMKQGQQYHHHHQQQQYQHQHGAPPPPPQLPIPSPAAAATTTGLWPSAVNNNGVPMQQFNPQQQAHNASLGGGRAAAGASVVPAGMAQYSPVFHVTSAAGAVMMNPTAMTSMEQQQQQQQQYLLQQQQQQQQITMMMNNTGGGINSSQVPNHPIGGGYFASNSSGAPPPVSIAAGSPSAYLQVHASQPGNPYAIPQLTQPPPPAPTLQQQQHLHHQQPSSQQQLQYALDTVSGGMMTYTAAAAGAPTGMMIPTQQQLYQMNMQMHQPQNQQLPQAQMQQQRMMAQQNSYQQSASMGRGGAGGNRGGRGGGRGYSSSRP